MNITGAIIRFILMLPKEAIQRILPIPIQESLN